jgi:hypothetical protein
MAGEKQTVVILTSTTAGADNHFTKMSQIKDPKTGKLLFHTVILGKPCDLCLKAGGEYWLCQHKKDEKPDWLSDRKKQRWSIYYEQTGQTEIMKRELYSIHTTDGERIFEDAYIEMLKNAPFYESDINPVFGFIGIDPSGGGSSRYGMVSGFWRNGTLVVSKYFFFII